ncbi:MAG: hypothetical protein JW810_08790 [Sedimentisphaerales bacterium]|nr:hypothetical protein [Sedimentisphaerales bacterium]
MIGAIGDSSQQLTLLQLIQQLQNSGSTSESTVFSPPNESEMEQMRQEMDSSIAEKLGLDTATFTQLHSEIQQAVQEARSELDAAGAAGDMRSMVDSAVNGVLEANGIDPEEFQAAMKSAAEELGLPAPGAGGPMGPPGGAGTYGPRGMPSSQAAGQDDLLTQLLEELASGSDDSSDGISGSDILSWLQSLPAGSLTSSYA